MRLKTLVILLIGIAIGIYLALHSEQARSWWLQLERKYILPKFEKLKTLIRDKIQSEMRQRAPIGGSNSKIYSNLETARYKDYTEQDTLSQFHSPIRGFKVTSPFGWRIVFGKRDFHQGIDLVSTKDDWVYAVCDGYLLYKSRRPGYGNLIILRHSARIVTKYAHLQSFAPTLSYSKAVNQHQRLGLIGETGRTTGKHLHYEIIKDGEPINPLPYLKKW